MSRLSREERRGIVVSSSPELKRIVISDDEHLVTKDISESLEALGYTVTGTFPDGEQTIQFCREDTPDLVLLDVRMPKVNGLDAAWILYKELNIPVVIISAFSDPEYATTAARVGVFGYLLKPITQQDLVVTLPVAWAKFLAGEQSQSKIDRLERRLEDRKVIERAKWIVVEALGVTEPQAMQRLQKQSRDNRKPLAEVAKSVLENHDLFTSTANQ